MIRCSHAIIHQHNTHYRTTRISFFGSCGRSGHTHPDAGRPYRRNGMANRPNERIYRAPEPPSRYPNTKPGCTNRRSGIKLSSLLFIELRNGISRVIYARPGSYRIVIVLMWYNLSLRIFLYIRNTNTPRDVLDEQQACACCGIRPTSDAVWRVQNKRPIDHQVPGIHSPPRLREVGDSSEVRRAMVLRH